MTVKTVIDVSGAATHYTTPGNLRGRNLLCIHDEWTGDITATRTLQGSNHENPDTSDDTDWFDTSDALDAPDGSAGKEGVVVSNAAAKWYREKIVVESGAGTFTSRIEHVAASTRS